MSKEGPAIFTSDDPALMLGPTLTRGIGSSLFHMPGDPDNVFYSATDRGPNIDRDESTAKTFPQPDFVPSIQRIELGIDGTFRITQMINICDAVGRPITGLPNPLKVAKTELAYDKNGARLPFDPNGLDTEGLVRLSDGTFWLADEYAPSLVHVAADGRIIERLVPRGLAGDLANASYAIRETLPAILAKRHLNRGFEGIAISPDEKFLYAMMQNPLANPDIAAYKRAKATRLFKIEAATGQPVTEYVYELEPHTAFTDDTDANKQSDVRISELSAFGPDKLVVLERVTHTTKLYAVNLASGSDILGLNWDDIATAPSLEQVSLAQAGITPLVKVKWLDSTERDDIPSKIEGVAIIPPDTLVIINDNDFGIESARTKILRLKLPMPVI
jgi:hypothetical protein